MSGNDGLQDDVEVMRTGLWILLLGVGLTQMAGYALDSRWLKVFGKISAAAPLPLVFSAVDGFEIWAAFYRLEIVFRSGTRVNIDLTSESFAQISGSHLVKLSYVFPWAVGPKVPRHIWIGPIQYGFCNNGPMSKDFGFEEPVSSIKIMTTPKKANWETWSGLVDCG